MRADPSLERHEIGADDTGCGKHKPDDQRNQGDAADPLHPEMVCYFVGRAEATDAAELRTHFHDQPPAM